MERIATIGLDLAKQVFQVHGIDRNGKKVLTKKLDRSEVKPFFKKLRRCIVAMEATGGAHHWAREIAALGHKVMMIPGQYVKPFVKRGKTDALDAEAIAVAATQPGMSSVPIKSRAEQAVATLMKARMLFVRERTTAINCLRSLLAEFGYVVPVKRANVGKLGQILRDQDAQIPEPARAELQSIYELVRTLDDRIDHLSRSIAKQVEDDEMTANLTSIPGVGPITAAMTVAIAPDSTRFKSARHFASWLGLTPRSLSSGGVQRAGRISKRGNVDLRTLLILGAFGVLVQARKHASRSPWIASLVKRKPFKVAAVALANKTARIMWALMSKGGTYVIPEPSSSRAI